MNRNRPGIWQIGTIRDEGHRRIPTHWGVGLCIDACKCHMNPLDGKLNIHEDPNLSVLGLARYIDIGCTCCEPWTVDELQAMLDTLAKIEASVAPPATEDQP